MKKRRNGKHGGTLKFKVSLGLLTAAGICIILLLVFWFQSPGMLKKPDQILENYFAAVESKDYKAMYQMLNEESRAKISEEDFVTRNRNIYEGIEAGNFDLQVKNEEKSGGTSELECSVSMDSVAGQIIFDKTFEFVKEKRNYRLEWSDDIILPELTGTDKVRVSEMKAKRGTIYDRNQLVLAEDGTASNVGLVPGKMGNNKEAAVKKLAELLDVSEETIQKKLSAKWVTDDSFVPVKAIEKVTSVEADAPNISEDTKKLVKLKEDLLSIPGVMISDTDMRVYPYKEAAAHVTGYVQKVTAEDLEAHQGEGYTSDSVIGKSGLEVLYEDRLRGENGYQILILSEDGEQKEIVASKPKTDGEDITVTIDISLQKKIYEAYASDKSCSVVMNPKNGEVLALVSTPSYDANLFVRGMTEKEWSELNENEDKPLQNRFRAVWCPGSSFKPVTAAIGLTTERLSADESLGNDGLSWQKDDSWGSYKVTTLHAASDGKLKEALVCSDNIYFAKAALKLGAVTFLEELPKLGFNEQLAFPIQMSKSRFSNGESFETEIQLADSGYGQGQMLINPLHLADIYSAFVNEGSMVKPKLLLTKDSGTEYWKEQVFSKEAVKEISSDLVQVIESSHGTGRGCKIEGMKLVGKTGTAEIKASKDDKTGTELGWFVVFTPDAAKEESFCLVTMTEDVKNRGGSGYVVDKTRSILSK